MREVMYNGKRYLLYSVREAHLLSIPYVHHSKFIPGYRYVQTEDDEVVPVVRRFIIRGASVVFVSTPVGVYRPGKTKLYSFSSDYVVSLLTGEVDKEVPYFERMKKRLRKDRDYRKLIRERNAERIISSLTREMSKSNPVTPIAILWAFMLSLRNGKIVKSFRKLGFNVNNERDCVKLIVKHKMGDLMVAVLKDVLEKHGITPEWVIERYKDLATQDKDLRVAKQVLDAFARVFGFEMSETVYTLEKKTRAELAARRSYIELPEVEDAEWQESA